MTDLREYLGKGTTQGTRAGVWMKVVVPFIQVGQGEFTEVAPDRMTFDGKVEAALFRGEVRLTLALREGGGAELGVNGLRGQGATYTADARRLTVKASFDGKPQSLVLERGGKGEQETYLTLAGVYGASIHLAPAPGQVPVA